MKIRLSVSPLFVGLLVFSMGACRKSPPTTAVAVGADWTMCGRTNEEQRFSPLMPSFKDVLKPDQVQSIQAYVLSQAAAASKPHPAKHLENGFVGRAVPPDR
jgi:hypothetical protein